MSGGSNFEIDTTSLTVGGFSQPSVARTLIEQSASAEIGLTQRFLWCFPKPSYSRFSTLEKVDDVFTQTLGKSTYMYMYINKCVNSYHRQWLLHACAFYSGQQHDIEPSIIFVYLTPSSQFHNTWLLSPRVLTCRHIWLHPFRFRLNVSFCIYLDS